MNRLYLACCLALCLPLPASTVEPPLVHEAVVDAPVVRVWEAFTVKQQIERWMVAQAEIDLRVGGRWLTHYDPKGKLGDAQGIEHVVLAYDPQRMLAFRTVKCPETFPFKRAMESVWSVVYFEPVEGGKTRVRLHGLGYGSDEESKRMRAFFEKGNAWTLHQLQKLFSTPAEAK